MRVGVHARALLVATGAVLVLSALPAIGQEKETGAAKDAPTSGAAKDAPAAPEREKTQQEYREILSSRNRDTMHPGDPLLLIGVDQDGHDMRKGTPILEQSDKKVVMVDQQVAYERALALYAAGATYTAPLPAATDSDVATAPKRAAARPSSHGSAVEGGPQWPWLIATAICVAFIVWLGRRFAVPTKETRAH